METLINLQELTGKKYLVEIDRNDKKIYIDTYKFISYTLIAEAASIKAEIKFSQRPNIFVNIKKQESVEAIDRLIEIWEERNLTSKFLRGEIYAFKKAEYFVEIDDDPLSTTPAFHFWEEGEEWIDPLTEIREKVILTKTRDYSNFNTSIKIQKELTPEKTFIKYFEKNESGNWENLTTPFLKEKLKNKTVKNRSGIIQVQKFSFIETFSGGSTTQWVFAINWLNAADISWYKYNFALSKMDDKFNVQSIFGNQDNKFIEDLNGGVINSSSRNPFDISILPLDSGLKKTSRSEMQFNINRFFERVGARTTSDDRGKNNKHNFENELDFQSQTIKTKSEKELRESQLSSLFKILIKIDPILKNIKDIDAAKIEFDLRTIDIKAEMELWENLLKRYKEETLTLEEVLERGDGDSKTTALARAKAIRNEFSKKKEILDKSNFDKIIPHISKPPENGK